MASSLTSLLKQTHIEDHDEILKSANNALKQSKTDLESQHIKIVALLKLDRYEDALRSLEAGGEKLKQKARLEYAYALYKTGKSAQAAEIAAGDGQRGLKHVEAQARYRSEDFPRAAELYGELSQRLEGDVEADLRVNSGAVDAQVEWSGKGRGEGKVRREDLEAFETAYNAACGSIARGELGQGEVLLKRARSLCMAVEDMSDEDKETELLPITVQQAYVLVRLGRVAEAEELVKSVDPKKLPDESSRLVARVNGIAASKSVANPFLAQRLLAFDLEALKPDYPFEYQSAILKQNGYAVDLLSMKYGGVASSTQASLSKQSGPTLDAHSNGLSVVNAAAHAKNQAGKEALKHILPLLEKRPHDIGLILTIVQLYVLTGNSSSATTLLETFLARLEKSYPDLRYAPGLTGTLVSLYTTQSRREPAHSELAKAATHWRRKSKPYSPGVVHLLKAAGSTLLESPKSEHQTLSREVFQDLHAADASDRFAAAGLLAASPDDTADADLSSLTPVERLISGIDASALESAGIAAPPKTTVDTSTNLKRPATEAATTSKPAKPKKIRATKMPKDFDPSKTPDPERWLPLKDRSSYRPKGKKGKARQAQLAQGAVESEGSRPGTPGGEVIKGKGQQGGGGAKKKKGKGGKW